MAEPAFALPRLYTEIEAAEYLGVRPETLQRERRAGDIGYITVARREYRYREDHLREYLEARECPRKNIALVDSGSQGGQTGKAGSSPGTTPNPNSAGFALLAQTTFKRR